MPLTPERMAFLAAKVRVALGDYSDAADVVELMRQAGPVWDPREEQRRYAIFMLQLGRSGNAIRRAVLESRQQ